MTTFFREKLTCVICGSTSKHEILGSTNTYGSADLDLRPPEMHRSTMDYWVQECPFCGYVYSSIEKNVDKSNNTIPSKIYVAGWFYQSRGYLYALLDLIGVYSKFKFANSKDIIQDPIDGYLTRRFLKASLIAEEASNINAAANYALNAAWAADDALDRASATSCRHRAASLFEKLLKGTDHNSEEAISICAIMVDILRRSEQWEKAASLAETTLSQNVDPTIKSVLEFEISAASGHDAKCYTIDQALGEK